MRRRVEVIVEIDKIRVREGRRSLRGISELANSMERVGLLNPITLTEQLTLIAGFHRIEAAKQLGWTAIDANIKSLTELEAELAEIDENLVRNELTALERAEELARRKRVYLVLYPETKHGAQGGGREGKGTRLKTETAESAVSVPSFVEDSSAKIGRSERGVRVDVQIATAIPAEVRDLLRDTPIADQKTDLLKIARMSPEQQKTVAERISAGDPIKKVMLEARKASNLPPAKVITPDFPDGPFRCIVIDPPWPIEKIAFDRRAGEKLEMDYATMSLEEIANLPVSRLADPSGTHVYLWVTHHFLPEGIRLFEKWGVRYECLLTWIKPTAQPLWWRFLTEHILFGKIGSLSPLKKGESVCFTAPQQRHSHKPDEFFDLVRRVSPEPRITLFDGPREGFESWGVVHDAVTA